MLSSTSPPYYDLNFNTFGLFSTLGTIYTVLSYVYAYLIGPKPQIRQPKTTTSSAGKKKVAIVTGSNTGIGYETARALVVDYGVDVIMACRSRDKAEAACAKINNEGKSKAKATFLHPLDLLSFASVEEFATKVHEAYPDGIDVLVNNAGVSNSGCRRSEDGLETIFQTNFLGHFLLTNLVLDLLLKKPDPRIVNLSSVFHHFGGGHNTSIEALAGKLDSVEYWKGLAQNDTSQNYAWVPAKVRAMTVDFYAAYPASKLAAILFAMELNRRLAGKKVRCFAVDPGAVNSDIYRDTPKVFHLCYWAFFLACRQGCQPSLAAAVDDELTSVYLQPYWMPPQAEPHKTTPNPVLEFTAPFVGYAEMKPRLPPKDQGAAAAKALWEAAEELTQQKFNT